ncbi:hypothetical protein BNJ_00372 [Kaumoebavirus]|uniref:hypothetical protein n=1 Tax=Kaumoebavirus TaxID=1859492 RepID=UPI0009C1B249|nr:hypothetical protein BNJ_00372 [Kaumoebavirus]ARA72192.1 hypothetical protein BNJ_00372 [Kaumoebavirus]
MSLPEQEKVGRNIEEAMKFAGELFRVIKTGEAFKEDPKLKDNKEAQFDFLKKKYPNFARAYLIVLKYMVDERKYSPKAFKKFLVKLYANKTKGIEGYVERQADYAMFLYMALNPRYSDVEARRTWQYTYDVMMAQYKDIDKKYAEAKAELQKQKDDAKEEKKRNILQFIEDYSELLTQDTEQ